MHQPEGHQVAQTQHHTNFSLTGHKSGTGKCWPKVVAAWTEHRKLDIQTTKGYYTPVQLKLKRLVSSLSYGTWSKLVYFDYLNTLLMTISVETVCMETYGLNKHQIGTLRFT